MDYILDLKVLLESLSRDLARRAEAAGIERGSRYDWKAPMAGY